MMRPGKELLCGMNAEAMLFYVGLITGALRDAD